MESIERNTTLPITGTIRSPSREKIYEELGLESLQQRLCYCFKISKKQSPKYLFNNIPTVRSAHRTRNIHKGPQFIIRHFYIISCFPSTLAE